MADIQQKLANVRERMAFLQSELDNPQRKEEEILQIHQEIFTLEGVIPVLEEKLASFNTNPFNTNNHFNVTNSRYAQRDEFHNNVDFLDAQDFNSQEDEDEDYDYDEDVRNQLYAPAQAMKRSRYQSYDSRQVQQLPNTAHDQQLVLLNELVQQERNNNDENKNLYEYIDLLQAKLLATQQELDATKIQLSNALKKLENGTIPQKVQLQSRSPLLVDWRNDRGLDSATRKYFQELETTLNENAISMKNVGYPDVSFQIGDDCRCIHGVKNQTLAAAFQLAIDTLYIYDLPNDDDPIYVSCGHTQVEVRGPNADVDMNNAMLFDFLNPSNQHGWVKHCDGPKNGTQHYHIEFSW